MRLVRVEGVGVSVTVNEEEHCGRRTIYGAYIPRLRKIVICQPRKQDMNGEALLFNAEDLDTLRHEAHHLVQDCMDGRLDGELTVFFDDASEARQFYSNYPREKIQGVIKTYSDQGAPAHVINIEIEAFAVAEQVPAHIIGDVVAKVCAPR